MREIPTGPWLNTFKFRTHTHTAQTCIYFTCTYSRVHELPPVRTYTYASNTENLGAIRNLPGLAVAVN